MNRIYQGRITGVTLADGTPLPDWESKLWDHHVLFQDAVNYYIVALAALSTSGTGDLADLRKKLGDVWDSVNKPGERRPGMRESLARRFAIPVQEFILDRAIALACDDANGGLPDPAEAENYGNFVLARSTGANGPRDASREFLPKLCCPDFTGNLEGGGADEAKAQGLVLLQSKLHTLNGQNEITAFAGECSLDWVVKLTPGADPWPDTGQRLRKSALHFLKEFDSSLAAQETTDLAEKTRAWLRARTNARQDLQNLLAGASAIASIPIPKSGKGVADRTEALLLFKYFPNDFTHCLLKFLFPPPSTSAAPARKKQNRVAATTQPIGATARGQRAYVLRAFTTNVFFGASGPSDFASSGWNREFDIAAFKEALTAVGQFRNNVENRQAKINRLAARLLLMAGAAAESDLNHQDAKAAIAALQSESRKKWVTQAADVDESPEEESWPSFEDRPGIGRLQAIIKDLEDETGLPFGLRERTMKGWSKLRPVWRKIAKDKPFSTGLCDQLQAALNHLRQDKPEEIGSHRLFEALIKDEAAWDVWRGEDERDLLDEYRRYCETVEELESRAARLVGFTPADPKFSRRLFSFTDACSFGKARGTFKHDPTALAATLPLAIADLHGAFRQQAIRVTFSAPRLLRDRLRCTDGRYIKTWSQPMADALWGAEAAPIQDDENMDGAAVELMPDWDKNCRRRFLLNFAPVISNDELINRVRQLRGQQLLPPKFSLSWSKAWNLRWPGEPGTPPKLPWWEHLGSFTALGVDLGTRQAGAAALVEVTSGASSSKHARFIGEAGGKQWHARYRAASLLRLPGEDRKIWRGRTGKDKDPAPGAAFREELYGSRGRTAEPVETEQARSLIAGLGYPELTNDLDQTPFPVQNYKLLTAVRWAQRQMARENRWLWMLGQPEKHDKVIEEIRESGQPRFTNLAGGALLQALRSSVEQSRDRIPDTLLQVTERILPVRARNWEFAPHPDATHFPKCHLLRRTAPGTGLRQKKLAGQRGLSMARVEQLIDLRRRWQSLNQSLRGKPGDAPLTAAEMRNQPVPDPCPDLLRKLDQIREQRVNQTAHLILAEALGVRLRAPSANTGERRRAARHGEYESFRPPVDLIVIENLSRYLTSQGRTHSENGRLMQWCHRQVANKLIELAEPFGIPVLLTPAAYSSQFCSLTGTVGFRAVEVSLKDRDAHRWRKLLEESSEEARNAKALFEKLAALGDNRTLLAPQAGGPVFVRAVAGAPEPIHADINAAINISLRAVAVPERTDIHHRVRTERGAGGKYTTRESRRAKVIVAFADAMPASEKFPNIFPDPGRLAPFGRATLGADIEANHATWKALGYQIKEIAWQRCAEINLARISKWRGRAARAAGEVF